MKTHLKRLILLVMTLMLFMPSAHAAFDVIAALQQHHGGDSYVEEMLEGRDQGACRMMRGDIELTVIMVEVDGKAWTVADLAGMINSVEGAIAKLEEEAADYGVELNITPVYYRTSGISDVNADGWRLNTLASIPELSDVPDWKDRPLMFCLNTEGRCFARTGSWNAEYVIYYVESSPSTVRHELLHLYGAEDFYYHEGVEAAAELHFPNTIMIHSGSNGSETDPLTAYLVGWTDEPGEEAQAFLDDIASLTATEVSTAHALDQQSGTGTFKLDTGMFYGTLEMGVRNGLGLHQWESGMAYVGDWVWGAFDGHGTLTWGDGSYYTGDFVDDKRTGKGTYVGSDGSTYTGDFVNGSQSGKGTLTWITGDSYTGDFVNGRRTGRGTFTWADGSYYTGEFIENNITGLGMMTFVNGDLYIGQFQNGALHGLGTMYYADGTIKTGKWSQDAYIGE